MPLFFLLLCHSAKTQVIGNVSNGATSGLNLVLIQEKVFDKVQGSPYLTEDYVWGEVFIKDKKPIEALLRYNVAAEHFEIKTRANTPKVFRLPYNSHASYYVEPETFIWEQFDYDGRNITGYFVEKYKGENYRLLQKYYSKFTKARSATTSYERNRPATMEIDSEFFIVSKEGLVMEAKISRRKLKKLFPSEGARNYLEQHKIREEQDLTKFVKFLDQQQRFSIDTVEQKDRIDL